MKTVRLPKIALEARNIPFRWMDTLVANRKIGGVLLVFLEGKNNSEIKRKVKAIKKFCKELKVGDNNDK